jgi:hypothetical protein
MYCINSRGQPTKSGPLVWGLGEVLTTIHCENVFLLRNIHKQILGPGLTLVRSEQ